MKVFDLLKGFTNTEGEKCFVKEMNEDTGFLEGEISMSKNFKNADIKCELGILSFSENDANLVGHDEESIRFILCNEYEVYVSKSN